MADPLRIGEAALGACEEAADVGVDLGEGTFGDEVIVRGRAHVIKSKRRL